MDKSKYSIEKTLSYEQADEGGFRSYDFSADGNSLEELISSGAVHEVDQDGGEINTECFLEYDCKIVSECYELIENEILTVLHHEIKNKNGC